MKAIILKKLKSISKPDTVFHPFQLFQTFNENLSCSDILEDSEEEKTAASGPNADGKEKTTHSIISKEERDHHLASESKPDNFGGVIIHDKVQLLKDHDTSLEIATSTCRPSILKIINSPVSNSNSIPTTSFIMENHIGLDNGCNPVEHKCPPGGNESIVLYSTSLRGIRKTFEDCNAIRFLLESFRVVFYERDVSMHLEYRDELWEMLGGRVVPPRLFIKGRYVGGADEVVGLHEKGTLRDLLQGMPLSPTNCQCRGCGNMRFVLCSRCNGSRKVVQEGRQDGVSSITCHDCNENGLVKCSVCS